MIGESYVMDVGDDALSVDLGLPEAARGVVVFAHGVGRQSVQSRATACDLMARGWGALVFDLLTAEEAAGDAQRGALRFDIGFLGRRLVSVLDVVADDPRFAHLPVALLGAGTGAAAALVGAAWRPNLVGAVVARGGRPDLATPVLKKVKAPTLLCAGGRDLDIVRASQECLPHLPQPSRMLLIPGAGPGFDEPASIKSVGRAASTWFNRHIAPPPAFRVSAPEGR